MQLADVQENKVLWENPSLVFRQDYDNTSGENAIDVNAFFGQEVNALDRVSSDFARTVVARSSKPSECRPQLEDTKARGSSQNNTSRSS